MATTTNIKTPSEVRILSFLMAALVPAGASISSAAGFASRKIAGFSTTVSTNAAVEASTLELAANPGIGALLTVEPSGVLEETFKVTNVTGGSPPFVCTLSHTAEFAHSSGAVVNYEPGVTSRFLTTPTATVIGTQAFLTSQYGADGQTYRTSVLGTLSNGEIIELEMDVFVSELAPSATPIRVQVDEIRDIAIEFAGMVDVTGSGLDTAVAYVSREVSASTTLSAPSAIGDTTLSLVANPGVGALLTLNPTGATQEKLKVSAVGGGGPYTCTVDPTPDFAHAGSETVNYEPGASARLLTGTSATIVGTDATVRKRRGVAGQTYRLTLVATMENGEKVTHATHVAVEEV